MKKTAADTARRKAGECLKVMMLHNQMSIADGMELFGINRNTLLAYRAGESAVPYKTMIKMIEVMQPSEQMKATFMSAVQLSVLETWRNHGQSRSSLKRRGEIKNG